MNLAARNSAASKASGIGDTQGASTTQSRETVKQADSYTCSMHPDIRTAAPGKCPKCGMALVAISPDITDYYDLKIESTPAAPKANEKVRLRFAVINPKTGEQVKQFQVLHDKLFHLFIISQDLTEFQHIHPTIEPDGRFTVETTLPRAGNYKVYSDFYPSEGTPQVLQQNLVTAGYAPDLVQSEARLAPDTTLLKTGQALKITPENAGRIGVSVGELGKTPTSEMKIALSIEPAKIIAGQPVVLKFHLTNAKTGEPIRDVAPYLGAWGHTLILSEDQSDYVHSHPEETVPETGDRTKLRGGPDVTFNAFMPKPGNYRIWTQFLRGDMLTTVTFTVRAERLR
ncbi:MAG TPA: heavy metal-binding domain-containing protein [Blastocatellia bacterium]|nr:heavy metal-binding domain-containing protein [Blastocatellia bacterium]